MNTEQNTKDKDKALHIGVVSGSVKVIKGRNINSKRIYCGDWINDSEYFIIEDYDGYIVIKKCYMEIPKKAKKIDVNGNLEFIGDIPIGTFDIDEESNEDELVVYYR